MSRSGIAIRTEMCQAGGAIRAEETHRIQQRVDTAELLGAPHVRVFAGNLPGGASEKQGIEWVVEAMKPACDYATKRGITVGIENHRGMTARASTAVEILRRVDSPYAESILIFPTSRAKRTTRCIPISGRVAIFLV
jgi:L-ribulose-5-phosphate 3-epimerase